MLVPEADLSVTKDDGMTVAIPGDPVTYTIVASNAGPSNVMDATVADTFPAELNNCTWSCVASLGSSCTAGPAVGNINDTTVDLLVNGTATYTATCDLDLNAVGNLVNTATVTAPGGVTDPVPGNNSVTDTNTINEDVDGDGVDNVIENGAPNNGDGNSDNIPDSTQNTVASLPNAVNGAYFTLVVKGNCSQIDAVTVSTEADLGTDSAFDYPDGLLGFELPCTKATVTVYYHGQAGLLTGLYRKYGPLVPSNADTKTFYTYPGVIFGNANGVPIATFTLFDGVLGDDDSVPNASGRIIDPAGLAQSTVTGPSPPPESIPTLSEWARILLMLAFAALLVLGTRRRA
jgi:uncharacterized repeat protein (TIGR01451 family)